MVTRDLDVYLQQLKTNNGPGTHSAQVQVACVFRVCDSDYAELQAYRA
jgi:hypothetical protein